MADANRDLPTGVPGADGPSALVSMDTIAGYIRSGALGAPAHPGCAARRERWDILRLLGQGGMGAVFLARETAGGEGEGGTAGAMVAIKVMQADLAAHPQAVQRFLKEARHMAELRHPHILRVLHVGQEGGSPYYVMPWASRGSLAQVLRGGKPLEVSEGLRLARQLAEALTYAHARGIIHRDLKPANVLLDENGDALLCDFGLVRTVFNDTVVDPSQMTPQGTAPYMSPAVARGEAEDTRCDIYSLGALMYEMFSGVLPYEGASSREIVQKVLAGPPVPLATRRAGLPAGLVQVVEGAMARELRDRYAQMSDLLADLKRVEAGQKPLGPRAPERPRLVRTGVVLGAVGVAVVAAGLITFWPVQPVPAPLADSTASGAGGGNVQKVPGGRPQGVVAATGPAVADEMVAVSPTTQPLRVVTFLQPERPVGTAPATWPASDVPMAKFLRSRQLESVRDTNAVVLAADGKTLAIAQSDHIAVLDAQTLEVVRKIPMPEGGPSYSAIAPDLSRAFVQFKNSGIGYLLELPSGTVLRNYRGVPMSKPYWTAGAGRL